MTPSITIITTSTSYTFLKPLPLLCPSLKLWYDLHMVITPSPPTVTTTTIAPSPSLQIVVLQHAPTASYMRFHHYHHHTDVTLGLSPPSSPRHQHQAIITLSWHRLTNIPFLLLHYHINVTSPNLFKHINTSLHLPSAFTTSTLTITLSSPWSLHLNDSLALSSLSPYTISPYIMTFHTYQILLFHTRLAITIPYHAEKLPECIVNISKPGPVNQVRR